MSQNNQGDFIDRQDANFITDTFEKGLDRVCDLFTAQIENVKQGIDGVNARLDTVNGRLYKHEGRISALESREGRISVLENRDGRISALESRDGRPSSRKVKIAAGTVGGVSVLAVLHSLFEMVRSIGPAIMEMFRHGK
jgi:tetrahydromethanopterin S-methyltransferase subunit G